MAQQVSISPADLRTIEKNLATIYQNIETLNGSMTTVNDNVRVVYDELGQLAQEFHAYVKQAEMQHNVSVAETRLVKIRQELETKYGYYAEVRRTTTGILQADDLGIVRKETISTATEELMISAPNYWLAPCLVALAAWISDQKQLAEMALHEGIKRDDKKTSLLFALICRRAGRRDASLKWTKRYLENQDERKLDRACIVILDAYASGLLGADSEGLIAGTMTEWLDSLAEEPGFVEKQTDQWSDAINLRRMALGGNNYPYLQKYSKTWPLLQDIMEGAHLHAEIYNYFEAIFSQESSVRGLEEQLDEILSSLVTDFDAEELPLRQDETLNQLVIKHGGDLTRAQSDMQVEKTAFEEEKDFTQLLTDAAMKPESSHASASTQKFAIALSKDWITNAYRDVVAKNRAKVPHSIEINIENFNDQTSDGQNQQELEHKINAMIDNEKAVALKQAVLSAFDKFCLIGGIAIGVIGIFGIISSSMLLGLVGVIVGAGLVIRHFSRKKAVDQLRQNIDFNYEQKRNTGIQILRATLAEVVDFRTEFQRRDSESTHVEAFLDQISPDQYVRSLSDSTRRIKVTQ